MNKWWYLVRTFKQVWFNLFCKDKDARQWLMSEEDHEYYIQMRLDYAKLKAERDMWYNIAQVSNSKLQYMVEWVNKNWSKQYEK